jgi:septum formation protein
MSQLILASTSRYRRELLKRLGIEFQARAPDVDETRLPGEHAPRLATRLADAKAARIAGRCGSADVVVIGADQVAELDGELLRKPGDQPTALRQLRACQGRTVIFHTAVTVIAPALGEKRQGLDQTSVRFSRLSESKLRFYLQTERPYDCAGGFRAEGLGITLFEGIESQDPTALLGLPLIWLTGALRELHLDPLDPTETRR